MNESKNRGTAFLSVFLLTLLITTEALTLPIVWQLELLSGAALALIAGSLASVTLLLARGLFPRKPRLFLLKRLICCTLSICLTAGCAAAAYTAFIVDSSLDTMFGNDEAPPSAAPANPTEEAFIVYLGGSDTRSSTLTKSRCDVNILAVINPNTKQALLVNTPRDYYVSNPAGSGAKDKLAHCSLYGMDNAKQALSDLYGIPVSYGGVINFKGFETLIDALGGVTVYSDTAFTTTAGGYYIKQGENTLNGAQALAFARERSKLSGGDNTRGKNQMQVITAMVRQLSGGNLLTRWRDIMDSLEGMFTTDMPLRTITKFATNHLSDIAAWEILSTAVTGTSGTDYNWSSGGNAYVMYPDDSVARVSALMQRVLDGQRITAEDIA